MAYLQLTLKTLVILSLILVIIRFRLIGSTSHNEQIAAQWFESMDVVASGQRWKGSRSELIVSFYNGRSGMMGYRFDGVCVTRSGRFFRLKVEAHLGVVDFWSIAPMTREESRSAIGLDLEEFEKLFPVNLEDAKVMRNGSSESLQTS